MSPVDVQLDMDDKTIVQPDVVIDPKKKATVQYDLERLEIPKVYGPEDEVPVLIWNEECKVDMKDMFDYLSFLF